MQSPSSILLAVAITSSMAAQSAFPLPDLGHQRGADHWTRQVRAHRAGPGHDRTRLRFAEWLALRRRPCGVLQPFVTSIGQPAFLPPLWLNPFAAFFVVSGGFAGQFPFVLPHGGGGTRLFVPPGVAGVSALAQAAAVDASGALIVSDGVEIILK